MGIYRVIKDNSIYISLHLSKNSDTYIFFDANEALTHVEILLEGLKNTTTDVDSVDNLFDFFAAKRLSLLSPAITSFKEKNHQETLKNLIDDASNVVKAFPIGEIIKLINLEYKNLITRKNTDEGFRELFFPIVEFCVQYQSGVSDDVFKYLATEHWFVFIKYYDDLKRKLLLNPSIYELVFIEENIKKLIRSNCQVLIKIAKSMIENKQSCAVPLVLLNTLIITISIEVLKTAYDRDLLVYGDSMRRIRRYFSEIDYDQQELIEFEDAYKIFETRLTDYLDNHGSVFSQNIPADIADIIFKSNNEWITKLLLMTHSLEDEAIVSKFTYSEPTELSIIDMDMVSHNIDTDEYFTFRRQSMIEISASVGTALLMQIYCNQKYREDLFLWIATAVDVFVNEKNLKDEHLIQDLLAMEQALLFVDTARKKHGEVNSWSLVYGASMLIISNIEKMLRLIYKSEKNLVLSDEHIQLGPLLNNETIREILTNDLMKGVGFYLSKYGYIGLNYRNRLAHLSDIKIDEIPQSLPYTLFYLYMCVINGILIHYYSCDLHNNN